MPPAKDPTGFCKLFFGVTWVKIFNETNPPGSCFNLKSQSLLALIGGILCAKDSSISAVSQAGFATGTEHHIVGAALFYSPQIDV